MMRLLALALSIVALHAVPAPLVQDPMSEPAPAPASDDSFAAAVSAPADWKAAARALGENNKDVRKAALGKKTAAAGGRALEPASEPAELVLAAAASAAASGGGEPANENAASLETRTLLVVLMDQINELRKAPCGPLGAILIDSEQSIAVTKRIDDATSVTHEFTAIFSMDEVIEEKSADGKVVTSHVRRNGLKVEAEISEVVDDQHTGDGNGFMKVGCAPKPSCLRCIWRFVRRRRRPAPHPPTHTLAVFR